MSDACLMCCALAATESFAAALRPCLDDVLSTMFFAEVLGEITVPVQAEGPQLFVALSFSGSIAGELLLTVPEEVAATLATDFSGCDGTLDARAIECSVCELANMICGSTLSRIAPDAHVTLSHPELTDQPLLPGGPTRWFELSDGILALSFRIDRG